MSERIGATVIAAECVRGQNAPDGGPTDEPADERVGGSTDLGGSHRSPCSLQHESACRAPEPDARGLTEAVAASPRRLKKLFLEVVESN